MPLYVDRHFDVFVLKLNQVTLLIEQLRQLDVILDRA